MSTEEPRRRLRDRFFFKRREKEITSGPPITVSNHTPTDLSIPPPAGGISSNSGTIIASSSNAIPVLSQSTGNAALKQPSNQDPVEACSGEHSLPITQKPVVAEPSLWKLAYDELQRSNSELIMKFNYCLGISSTDTDKKGLIFPSIDRVVQKAFEELDEARNAKEKLNKTSATIRQYFEQAVKIIIASKDYVSSAVSANPYAALAWTGISLGLPLLLNPTQENEAAIQGLDRITILMMVYGWKEKLYLHDGDAASDFRDQTIRLYTMILDYVATLLVHTKQNAPKRWARDVFQAGEWSSRITSIQQRDTSCRDVTNAIADVRAKEWRDEERRWQENLLRQPRQDEERRHIRMLYTNYEAGKNVNPERISGTCEWFSNHTSFLTWRVSQSSSLLWLSADPGCGKSVLAKYLVDRKGEVLTVNTKSPTVCYFFFKDGDIDRRDGAKAICAFLHQLILQQPHLYRYAKEDFENKSEKFLTDLDALWNIFLKATANAPGREIICVLDALDECQEHSRRILTAKLVHLYTLRSSTNSGKPILKFLVTSRPDFNIVRDFKDLTSTLSEIRLRGEEESEYISREIDLVIHHKVKELGSRMDLSERDQSTLQENLLNIPHRTYLWLYLIFDSIKEKLELTKDEIAVIAKTIPKNIGQAYTAILDKSSDRERARRLLHIVLAAARPLSLHEANVAMVMEERYKSYQDLDIWRPDVSEDRIKNICGLFLSVVDSKVYLIHQTAREFLVSKEYTDSPPALQTSSSIHWEKSFSSMQSNLLLAKICIWYLQLRDFEKEDLAFAFGETESEENLRKKKLKDEDSKDEDSKDEDSKDEDSKDEDSKDEDSEDEDTYRFLSYAARYWAAHFTQAYNLPEPTLLETVADKVCNTLSQSFKIWFSIYWAVEGGHESRPRRVTNVLVESLFGHDAVVKLLLERKDPQVQADSKDEKGRTPLSHAAKRGHEAVVRLLLDRTDVQVQADSKDKYGQTPLSHAAERGHEAVIRLLLDRTDVQADSKDNFDETPLSFAAIRGHEAVVRLLLDRTDVQVQADSKDKYGQTPLSHAAINGHEAIVRLLLDRTDVQADSKDLDNRTPLSYVTENGHEAIVRLLLERTDVQADSKALDDQTPLSYAARNGHEAIVRLLLERTDVQADSKALYNRTPLSDAAEGGHEAVVRLLLERTDVQADSKDIDDRTPLSYAAEGGHEAVVRLLLDRTDVQADSKDIDDRTPLSYAAERGHEAVVRLLLKRTDVQADSKDNYNRTPLSQAAKHGHKAVVQLLEQHLHQTSHPHPPP